jgi:hypothetical protein
MTTPKEAAGGLIAKHGDPATAFANGITKAAMEAEINASITQPLLALGATNRPTNSRSQTVPNGTLCARSGVAWTPVSQARNRKVAHEYRDR